MCGQSGEGCRFHDAILSALTSVPGLILVSTTVTTSLIGLDLCLANKALASCIDLIIDLDELVIVACLAHPIRGSTVEHTTVATREPLVTHTACDGYLRACGGGFSCSGCGRAISFQIMEI